MIFEFIIMSLLKFEAIFLLAVVTCAYGATIDDSCLKCICKVESGCKAIGCNRDAGSDSCGYFQIKKPYYIDCGQPGKKSNESTETAWKRCADDYTCAKGCVTAYMNRYAARCKSNPTCEVFARVHNGGPKGCKYSSTIPYWNKVNKC